LGIWNAHQTMCSFTGMDLPPPMSKVMLYGLSFCMIHIRNFLSILDGLNTNRPPKPMALTSSMTLLGRALTMSNHFAGEHRIAGGWMQCFFLFASLAESTSSPPLASWHLQFDCWDSDR
jgi:hypothetical protein